MALNLATEFDYDERPEVPVRLRRGDAWIDILAMVDTGATVSLFDVELASALNVALDSEPERRLRVLGIGGTVQHIPCWRFEVLILPEELRLHASLHIGLVSRLAKSTGNLLGRGFLESFDLGLSHRERLLLLGKAGRSSR